MIGKPPTGPFRYFDKGDMAVVGKGFAVLQSHKFHMSGVLAWLAWAAVHLDYLGEIQSSVECLPAMDLDRRDWAAGFPAGCESMHSWHLESAAPEAADQVSCPRIDHSEWMTITWKSNESHNHRSRPT